jgi:hypothetical protein
MYRLFNPISAWNFLDSMDDRMDYIFKCTAEEAKKYPQFRWVALEEL